MTTSLSNSYDEASAVLLQPDGNIVAAGSTYSSSGTRVMGLARYQTNGNLDSSFGSGGKVVSKVAAISDSASPGPGAALQADGKIVVASGSDVARFNTNGSLDTSFNSHGPTKGWATVPYLVSLQGVVIQPLDGKIVVAGRDNQATEFELTRFNADGSLDSTFGSHGTATLYLGPSTTASTYELQVPLGLQADGKLVVAGFTGSPAVWEVARFNANGTLDTSFGSGGTVTTSFAPYSGDPLGLAIYPSTGQIVVVGKEGNDLIYGPAAGIALERYNTNGSIDTSFGTSGQVITLNTYGAAKAVALQADGKIVVAAQTTDPSGTIWRWSLLRYNTDGSLDTTFGTGGIVQTGTADPAHTSDLAVAIQADGNIVAAGYTPSGTGYVFMVARYLGAFTTGAPPTIPDPVPVSTDSMLTADPVPPVAFQRDAVASVLEAGTDSLLDYGTRPRDRTWTVSYATAGWASSRSRLWVQAPDSDGVFGDPFALALTVP